jgi:hypothetical protein
MKPVYHILPPNVLKIHLNIILPSMLSLRMGLFPSIFLTEIVYAFLITYKRTTYCVHLIPFNTIMLIMYRCAGSEVLTAVVMKSSVFSDITPRSPSKVKRRFGGTCPLLLKSRRINKPGKKPAWKQLLLWGVDIAPQSPYRRIRACRLSLRI